MQAQKGNGKSYRTLANELSINRKTVKKYLAAGGPPVYQPRRPVPTKIGSFMDHLKQRWAEGCHNAARLYLELVEMGYRGFNTQVRLTDRLCESSPQR